MDFPVYDRRKMPSPAAVELGSNVDTESGCLSNLQSTPSRIHVFPEERFDSSSDAVMDIRAPQVLIVDDSSANR